MRAKCPHDPLHHYRTHVRTLGAFTRNLRDGKMWASAYPNAAASSSRFPAKLKRPWGGSRSYRPTSCARVAEAATITAHHVRLSVLSFDSGLWECSIRHQVFGRTGQAWAYTSKRTKEHSDLVRGHASGHPPFS